VVPGVAKAVLTDGAMCGKGSVNLWCQVWQREC
jgi:hypothetical protein